MGTQGKKEPALSKSERTKKRIIHAAIDIISTKGIERATTREIAKKAKVANGLVSHYFPEIDRIFDEVIQEIAQEAYKSIESPPESSTGHDKIIHMCRANLDFFSAHPRYLKCFLLFYYFCSIRANLREMNTTLIQRAVQRCREYLKQHFAEIERKADDRKLDAYSTLIHDHLMNTVLKLEMIDHVTDASEFTERFLANLSLMLKSGLV
jgi:AcrR family transcriptional regulator